MIKNKKHWYDGWFYSHFIDNGGESLRSKVSGLIPEGSSVIDVACGTGALVFHLASKCSEVVGVELSKKMVDFANKKNEYDNVKFLHLNAVNLSQEFNERFDYAIISYALHEMEQETRVKVLEEMKKVAKELIIIDYNNTTSFITDLIEFLAGWDHYNNYKNFIKTGGLQDLIEIVKLNVKKRFFINKGTGLIILLM